MKYSILSNCFKISAVLTLLIFLNGFLYGQESEGSKHYSEEDLYFNSGSDTLFGKLLLPKSNSGASYPVVIFVHGSGPEDYSSSNLYRPLWERFTEAGFACFSWDRPGVGLSQGNWYEKSIRDRAKEVVSAAQQLGQHPKIDPKGIGFWGISQAGWVIPIAAGFVHPAFVITVSSPVTTAYDQEVYRLRSVLSSEGYSSTSVDSALTYISSVKNLIMHHRPYAEFEKLQNKIQKYGWSSHAVMGGEIIYKYLQVIIEEDQPPDLSTLTCPLLAIWGENDLLVPPKLSADTYKDTMTKIGNAKSEVFILPDADHTLTHNLSGKREETIERRKTYEKEPEKIFAHGYLNLMVNWLESLGFME
jgi:pimeloyl-ACP methyl ester carboxylesterase